ncbi:MAG: AMP-binding protein [Myxococcales bacterium]|nr:AMP-binding protein [Myxococcales bacterium]
MRRTLFPRTATDPHALALDDGARTRTWAGLEDRVARFANGLRDDLGLAADDAIAVLMHNREEGIEAVLAGIAAGVWVTPINWHLAPAEVEYVARDCGAKAVFADVARRALAGTGARVLVAGDELDAWLDAASDAPPSLDGPAGGNMIYTSGTTGRPKGVKRARPPQLGAALDAQAAYARRIGLDGGGPHLVTGPLYHSSPLMMAIYEMQTGAPAIVMPRWDERAFLEIVDEREVRHSHLVPTMFVRLLRLPDDVRARSRRPALDRVLHGAAPISPATKRAMIDWWGPILTEYWGGTEGGVQTLIHADDWLAHPGSVGRALPMFEIWAADDDGRRLPPGEVGTLFARDERHAQPFAYHGDPEKTAEAIPAPHVFTLGDMGSVDADGYVFLADRKSNMIISGGVNIYPAEIEQVLVAHPAVADVAVFGVPDDEWGESVKAAVELAPGFAPSPDLEREIVAFAAERLARYKLPRSVDFERELPRHPSGKLYVRRLKERYWAGRDKRI